MAIIPQISEPQIVHVTVQQAMRLVATHMTFASTPSVPVILTTQVKYFKL